MVRPFVLLVLFLASTTAHGALRVALLVGQPDAAQPRQLPAVVSLAEAELARHGETVALVERQAIDAVLAEQELSAAVGSADGAVRLGAILKADVLAVVLPDPSAPAAGGAAGAALAVMVFDAGSGVRLIDAALAAATPDDPPEQRQAERLAGHVLRAVEKAGKLRASANDGDGDGDGERAGRLRAVSFFPARNVDLPRSEDPRCQALVRLIERQLTNRPEVIVLERAQLASVTRERELSGETPPASTQPTSGPAEPAVPRGLQSSLIRVQLDVARDRRSVEAPAVLPSTSTVIPLDVRLIATDARGQRVAQGSGTGTTETLQELARALSRQLLEGLGDGNLAAADDASPPPAAEAALLVREADLLWRHRQLDQALVVAEAAYALSPTDRLAIAARARGRVAVTAGLVDFTPVRSIGTPGLHEGRGPERLKLALQQLDAAMSPFRYASDRRVADGGWSGEAERYYQETIALVRRALERLYDYALGRDRDPDKRLSLGLDEESLRLVRSIQRQFRHVRFVNDHRLDWSRVQDPPTFAEYSKTLWQTLPDLKLAHPYGEPDDGEAIRTVLGGWTDGVFTFEPEHLTYHSQAVFRFLTSVDTSGAELAWTMGGFTRQIPTSDAEIGALRETMQRLRAHPDHQVRFSVPIWEKNLEQWAERTNAPPAPRPAPVPLNVKVVRPTPGPAADPPARPVMGGTEGYWEQVVQLVDRYDPRGPWQYLRDPVVHGDAVYVLNLREAAAGKAVLQLMRYPLDGGPPQPLGAKEVSRPRGDLFTPEATGRAFAEVFVRGYNPYNGAPCGTDGTYYWIHDTGGTTLFPLAGGPPLEVRTDGLGLPGRILECAVLDGHLYVTTDDGVLARRHVKTAESEILISARRADQRSPLDDRPPFAMRHLIVDLPRQKLLFTVSSTALPAERCGVWSYTPATGAIERVTSDLRDVPARPGFSGGNSQSHRLTVRPLPGDKLFLHNHHWRTQAIVDLATGQRTVTYDQKKQAPGPSHEPIWFHADGWLWRGWARYKDDVRPTLEQPFPPIRPVEFKGTQWRWPPDVQPIDDRRVLVADSMGMWVVVPPAPGTPFPPRSSSSLPDAPAGGELPYTRARTLYDLTQTRDADYIVRPIVHEDALYAVALLPDRSLQLLRFDLADGSRRDLGKIRGLVEWREPEHGTRLQAVDWATGACIAGTAYYLSTPNGNLFEFPLDGSPARHAASVAPKAMPGYNRLASIDGKVFGVADQLHPKVAHRDSVNLTVYDPQTRQTTVLHCVNEKREPLLTAGGLDAQAIFADTPRRQLLMFIWPKELNAPTDLAGWWSCDISTGVCHQLVPWSHAASLGPLTPQAMPGGNYWLWTGHITAGFNPTDGSHRLLADYYGPIGDGAAAPAAEPDLEQRLAAILRRYHKHPPTAVDDEWIWFAGGRLKRDGSLLEEFPDPRNLQSKSDRAELVQLIDGGTRLIVADQASCWVLDLR